MSFSILFNRVLLLGILLSQATVFGQNLILNPSFENFIHCPEKLGNLNKDVAFWITPTEGSTDYFNTCSGVMGAPENFKGSQNANFGNGYAGLYLYAPDDYREYVQVKLTSPLQEGVTYGFSFYVSLADRSDIAIKEFGALFSQNSFQHPIKKTLSKMHLSKLNIGVKTYLEIGYSNFYTDTRDWIVVHTQFKAKGKEQYLTLGNFKDNKRSRKFSIKEGTQQGAYYYIDMVSVSALQSNGELKNIESDSKTSYELEKVHVFKNVLFNFDTYSVGAKAKKELFGIYEYLRVNKELHISILGHTDTIGSKTYNMALSKRRAESIANYIMSLGVSNERITWEGYGSSRPIKGVLESSHHENRRVEFVIGKQKKD